MVDEVFDFLHDFGIMHHDAWDVHHFAQCDDIVFVQEFFERVGAQVVCERFDGGIFERGDAGGCGEVDVDEAVCATALHLEIDAIHTTDIGYFVRVSDNRAGTETCQDSRRLADSELSAFEVDVGVDEGGIDVAAFEIDDVFSLVLWADACDALARNGDGGVFFYFTAQNVDESGVF